MNMTSTPAIKHISGVARRRPHGLLVCVLSAALTMAAVVASAQTVVHPTPIERAQHSAHVQRLKSQQQSRKLSRQLQKSINDTASKAYKHQPKVQSQMQHASSVRQRQSKARDRDLEKKVERAKRPLPVHTAPVPASSR